MVSTPTTKAPLLAAAEARVELEGTPAHVLLVEGASDEIALTTLATRLGVDAGWVVPMGGATNVRRFASYFVDLGTGAVTGLADENEAPHFARAGVRCEVCRPDLEAELIRALGVAGVEAVLAAQGQLRSFRTLQQMPAHRGGDPAAQLRRFFGSHSGHKERYARLLVDALDLDAVPAPLLRALGRDRPPMSPDG